MTSGHSTINTEIAVTSDAPFHCVWFQTEDRTAEVVLKANPHYWNTARGARLEKVVFLNDIEQQRAIELVCTSDGAVDIVTNVAPADAERVKHSQHAKLVAANALRTVFGIFNRDGAANPFDDVRLRTALNLAIDREKLVAKGLQGYGEPAGALTPRWTYSFLTRPAVYDFDREKARELLRESGWNNARVLRIHVPNEFETLGQIVAEDLRENLPLKVDLRVLSSAEKLRDLRALAERKGALGWDVFLYGWAGQIADAPPLELHYQVLGKYGALRRGGETPAFDDLYKQFAAQTATAKQAEYANELDKFVREAASALFLCSRQALYAVNKEVNFTPYASTFELAECEVSRNHWSRGDV